MLRVENACAETSLADSFYLFAGCSLDTSSDGMGKFLMWKNKHIIYRLMLTIRIEKATKLWEQTLCCNSETFFPRRMNFLSQIKLISSFPCHKSINNFSLFFDSLQWLPGGERSANIKIQRIWLRVVCKKIRKYKFFSAIILIYPLKKERLRRRLKAHCRPSGKSIIPSTMAFLEAAKNFCHIHNHLSTQPAKNVSRINA